MFYLKHVLFLLQKGYFKTIIYLFLNSLWSQVPKVVAARSLRLGFNILGSHVFKEVLDTNFMLATV